MYFKSNAGVHWSFWTIAAVALVWNLLGVVNFVIQLNPEMAARFPEAERTVIAGRPSWATGAFAIAAFPGVVGCVLLLLKKSAAHHLFSLSLIGVIITVFHALSVTRAMSLMALLPPLSSLIVAVFLIWYSKLAARKRWSR